MSKKKDVTSVISEYIERSRKRFDDPEYALLLIHNIEQLSKGYGDSTETLSNSYKNTKKEDRLRMVENYFINVLTQILTTYPQEKFLFLKKIPVAIGTHISDETESQSASDQTENTPSF